MRCFPCGRRGRASVHGSSLDGGAFGIREARAAVDGFGNGRMGMTRAIKLHIEELVLHGFGRGEHRRIGAAVRRELERLISEQGIPLNVSGSVSIPLLKAGPVQLRPGTTSA